MAVKLVALYSQPENPDLFDKHYFETHLPLVRRTPGLQRIEIAKIKANMMGGPKSYYMMTEMVYADQESFNAAMASPEGKAAAENVMSFASQYITLLVSEVVEEGVLAGAST